MKKTPLDKIIDIIREEMMTTGSTAGKPGFISKAPAEGPTSGFDPVMGKMRRKKKEYLMKHLKSIHLLPRDLGWKK